MQLLSIEFTKIKATQPAPSTAIRPSRNRDGRGVGERATFVTNGAAGYMVCGKCAQQPCDSPKVTCTSGAADDADPAPAEREFISETHPYCPGWTVTAIQRATDVD